MLDSLCLLVIIIIETQLFCESFDCKLQLKINNIDGSSVEISLTVERQ